MTLKILRLLDQREKHFRLLETSITCAESERPENKYDRKKKEPEKNGGPEKRGKMRMGERNGFVRRPPSARAILRGFNSVFSFNSSPGVPNRLRADWMDAGRPHLSAETDRSGGKTRRCRSRQSAPHLTFGKIF